MPIRLRTSARSRYSTGSNNHYYYNHDSKKRAIIRWKIDDNDNKAVSNSDVVQLPQYHLFIAGFCRETLPQTYINDIISLIMIYHSEYKTALLFKTLRNEQKLISNTFKISDYNKWNLTVLSDYQLKLNLIASNIRNNSINLEFVGKLKIVETRKTLNRNIEFKGNMNVGNGIILYRPKYLKKKKNKSGNWNIFSLVGLDNESTIKSEIEKYNAQTLDTITYKLTITKFKVNGSNLQSSSNIIISTKSLKQ